MDFSSSKQTDRLNEILKKSIDRGLEQSKKGELRPHQHVIAEIRNRYKLKSDGSKS
jgi:predicted transcriptional regulator